MSNKIKFLVFETFYSARESERGIYLTDALNKDAVLSKWQSIYCIGDDTSVETADGNRVELDDIVEISDDEFEVLNKYIEKL